MKTVNFNVTCYATYSSKLNIPDDLSLDTDTLLDYIRNHLGEAPVLEIEYLDDLDDVYESVTKEDIREVY